MLPIANPLQPLIDVAEVALLFFHDTLGFGWGASIVALTFAMRILILPLSIKQIRSMRALQALQPQMKAIQDKFKHDKERMNREIMEFYRENKINPAASCLPLILQMPIFISLFYLLRGEDFRMDVTADPPIGWLFVDSLIAKPVGAELVILLVLFIGTQIASSMVMASRVEGPQKAIMFGLPFVFAPFVATFPAGLAVYWITTNTWTLGQQFVVSKVAPPPDVPTIEEIEAAKPPPPPPRKRKKKKR